MDDSFLGREKVHNAVWGLIGGLIVFIVGIVWGELTGPEKVYVTNALDQRSDTLIVSVEANDAPDSLREELRSTLQNESPGSPEGRQESNDKQANSLKLPQLEMPSNVEGYTEAGIQSFAKAECPPEIINRDEVVRLNFQVFENAPLPELTPVFVTVYQRYDQEYSYLAMDQQYELHGGTNTIAFAADFSPAMYKLSYGFYLKTELSKKYPPFYSKSCWFQIEA